MGKSSLRIMYRCDGGPDIGMGHVMRGLTIIEELCQVERPDVAFVMKDFESGVKKVREKGISVETIPVSLDKRSEYTFITTFIHAFKPHVIIMDVLDTDQALMKSVSRSGAFLVSLDDLGEGRFFSSCLINVLVKEPNQDRIRRLGISIYEGPKYVTLNTKYKNVRPKDIGREVQEVLVTCGGGDGLGLALKVVKALCKINMDFRITTVMGCAFRLESELRELAKEQGDRLELKKDVPCLLDFFQRADVAVVSGGLTMHEALVTGTPSVAICQASRHQYELASKFDECGAMVNLGFGNGVMEEEIKEAVVCLISDFSRRQEMSQVAMSMVDGFGTSRVVDLILAGCQAMK